MNRKTWNVLLKVLSRLCTKVSQDRVMTFVKAALKWSPIFINKELEQAYDCLTNNNLSVIWVLLLTEKRFATVYDRDGYVLPDRSMLSFIITDNIIDRIISRLVAQIIKLYCKL